MKRPKLRKASKRMSCSKRYKIQKKVREHNRKLRREAKKKGVSKRAKKDPGVPSSAPFKEEVLREAEQRRLQIEEEKQKQQQAKKEERAKKRKQEREAAAKETQPKAKKARQEADEKVRAPDKKSRQFLCSQINKVLDTADVVIQVLDARDPLGCRCPQLEEAVLQRDGNKKLLLLLNKIDLVPRENVEQWMTCLQREFPVVAFKASTQIHFSSVKEKKRRLMASNPLPDLSRGAVCWGSTCLTELLTDYAAKLPEDTSLRVGVVGFPNVGKSSVINSLKGTLACNAGAKRGITRSMQEVHIMKNVKFLDSPAVPASASNPPASMALRGLQGEDRQGNVPEAVRTLLDQYDKTELMLQYNVPDFRNPLEFFTLLAKKRGYLQKGGVPDAACAASVFLDDVNGAKLRYHCKAPEGRDLPPYLSAAAVAELHGCWDVGRLEKGNRETLRGVRFPSRGSSISFTSSGPTAGSLSVADDPEEPDDHQTEPTEPTADDMGRPQPEPQEAPRKKKPSVQVQLVPVDTGPPTDDAYDFNTDFK